MPDYGAADRAFLLKAGSIIRTRLRFRSPSDPIAMSWGLNARLATVIVRSRRITTYMTETNAMHPLFGDKEHWYHENQRRPERTGWTGRAVQEAIDEAGDAGTADWLKGVAITSKYFEYVG